MDAYSMYLQYVYDTCYEAARLKVSWSITKIERMNRMIIYLIMQQEMEDI